MPAVLIARSAHSSSSPIFLPSSPSVPSRRRTNGSLLDVFSWTALALVMPSSSAVTRAADAAGDPVPYARSDGTSCIVYRGFDNHIHELVGCVDVPATHQCVGQMAQSAPPEPRSTVMSAFSIVLSPISSL